MCDPMISMKLSQLLKVTTVLILMLLLKNTHSVLYHNPLKCFKSSEISTSCLVTHLDDTKATYRSVNSMIPENTTHLTIICTTGYDNVLTTKTFPRLNSTLQTLTFWNCNFSYFGADPLKNLKALNSLTFHGSQRMELTDRLSGLYTYQTPHYDRLKFYNCTETCANTINKNSHNNFPLYRDLTSLTNVKYTYRNVSSHFVGRHLLSYQPTKYAAKRCLTPNIKELTFTECGIKDMEQILRCSQSRCCGNLFSLNFSRNSIVTSYKGLFKPLKKLEILDLSWNCFQYLSTEDMSELKNLKKLKLDGNPFLIVGENVFWSNNVLKEFSMLCDERMMQITPNEMNIVNWSVVLKYSYYKRGFQNFRFPKSIESLSLCVYSVIRMDTPLDEITARRLVRFSLELPQMNSWNTLQFFYIASSVQRLLKQANSLTELSVSHFIYLVPEMFAMLNRLQTLTLVNCRFALNVSKPDIFAGLRSLQTLNIEGIDFVTDNRVGIPMLFREVPVLRILIIKMAAVKGLFSANVLTELNELTVIRLNYNDLDEVPACVCNRKNVPKLIEIDLRYNYIKNLKHSDFGNCRNLGQLYLSFNEIKFLCEMPVDMYLHMKSNTCKGVFSALEKLAELFLAHNNIERFDFSLVPKSLQHLDLSHNKINLLTDYRNIHQNSNLKTLLLVDNDIFSFDPKVLLLSYAQLFFGNEAKFSAVWDLPSPSASNKIFHRTNLTILLTRHVDAVKMIRNTVVKNFITNYTSTYSDLLRNQEGQCADVIAQSKHLLISECYNAAVQQPISFSVVPFSDRSLKTHFYCQYRHECGRTTHYENLNKFSEGTVHQPLWTNVLDCGGVGFQEIPSDIPSTLAIDFLFLDGNNITKIQAPTMALLQESLQVLYLNNSHVKEIATNAFRYLRQLREIHLEKNELIKQIRQPFLELNNLAFIYIHNSRITKIDFGDMGETERTIIDLSDNNVTTAYILGKIKTKHLYLTRNKIKILNSMIFSRIQVTHTLRLDYNFLEIIPPNYFQTAPKLIELNLHSNLLQELNGEEFNGLVNLQILSLGSNMLYQINSSTFSHLLRMHTLDLSNNEIQIIDRNLFLNLANLLILNLSYNKIKNTYEVFDGLIQLKELYLSHNLLSELQTKSFANLKNLTKLVLNNNKLQLPEVWSLSKSVRSLNIINNSLYCDCDYMINFRNWLADTKHEVLVSPELVKCFSDQKNEWIEILRFDMGECQTSYELVLGLCAGIAFLLFAAVSALYYWRLEVQVWVYSRYGLRLFYKNQDEPNKVYDVFICYSSLDENFVINDLLPGLKDYRICIQFKDFLPGAYINDNIMDAVEKSSRTLLVFSPHFVQSPWCKFEFKMAHHKSLEDKCCRLILLLLENVNEEELEEEQKAYLRTNTYLRWDDRLFWQKLKFALPDAKPDAPDPEVLLLTQIPGHVNFN